MTLAEDFAAHIVARAYADLPEAAVDEALTLVLDYLGVALRGATTSAATIVAEYQARYASVPPEATMLANGRRISAPGAAFANAVAAHSIEMDDVDQHSFLHFSAPVVSAALAAGEAAAASGDRFVTAVVVGCEIMQALSDGANPGMRDRGIHSTAMCGVFGATAAAASIFGLSFAETVSAIGIAGAHAAGPLEVYGPTMQKRIQPGPAAANGIASARLAAMGYEGAPTILDGEFGILTAFTSTPDPAAARARLAAGAPLGIEYKPYACFRPLHTAIDCALALRRLIPGPAAITDLTLVRHPAWAEYHRIPRPRTRHEAQGSINHAVAVALVDGKAGLAEFGPARIEDPEIRRLSEALTILTDPDLPRGDSCRLRIKLADGRTLEHAVDYPKGSVQLPMSPEDHTAKFEGLTAGLLSPETQGAVRDLVARLAAADRLDDLLSAVRPPTASRQGLHSD